MMPLFIAHPWFGDENGDVALDILLHKLVKSYVRPSPFTLATLKVVAFDFIIDKHN